MLMLIEAIIKCILVQVCHFNTSHVNVNLKCTFVPTTCSLDFNTSHVNVNQEQNYDMLFKLYNFNTSHVNVNRF